SPATELWSRSVADPRSRQKCQNWTADLQQQTRAVESRPKLERSSVTLFQGHLS
ncbi:hypothetical protein M8C21_001709, partial [Ambrosia artemisiifolia]